MVVQQALVQWHLIGTITTGDGKWSWRAPYAGEFTAVGGYIKTLGTGAGTSTDIQIRNETDSNKDLLSTIGAFEVNSATNLLEAQVINVTNASFAANDVIDLDVDAISTSPADAIIWAVINLFVDDV